MFVNQCSTTNFVLNEFICLVIVIFLVRNTRLSLLFRWMHLLNLFIICDLEVLRMLDLYWIFAFDIGIIYFFLSFC